MVVISRTESGVTIGESEYHDFWRHNDYDITCLIEN